MNTALLKFVLTVDHFQRYPEHELYEDVERGVEEAGVDEHVGDVSPDLLPPLGVVDEVGAVGHGAVEADVVELLVHDRAVVGEDGRLEQ